MSDEIELRVDVPPDMHPDALSGLAKVLDVEQTVGRMALSAGREALSAMYRVYAAWNDAEEALQAAAPAAHRRQLAANDPIRRVPGLERSISGDVRMLDGKPFRFHGRENEYVEAAGKAFEVASKNVDARLKELAGFRDGLAKRVAEALDHPARRTVEGLSLAAEVRAHAKGLPDAKRWAFVAEAIEAGDLPTVAAILAAPPFLSGLSARQGANAREAAARRLAPIPYGQLVATEKVIDRVRAASQSFVGRYGKALALRNTPKAKADAGLAKLRQAG
jgi:hypothetical protein